MLSKSPWIFADEVIYADLARSIASGAAPSIRGVSSHSFGIVYPALIAPAWLAGSTTSAYRLIHLINAVIISCAAVPAFYLARRFVSINGALTVAAFSVLVPSMAYTSTVLTEVAFYPLFVLAVAAAVRALDTTTPRDQGLALAAIALAVATKVLAIALIGAMLLAILLLAMLARRYDRVPIRVSLRHFGTTLVTVVALTALLITLSVARGASPLEWFGAYAGAVRGVQFAALPGEFGQHLAVLSLYTAAIPLAAAALLILLGLGRSADRQLRLFGAFLAATLICTIGAVSVFAAYASSIDFTSTGTPAATPVYERNLFVVTPLLLVALALWIERGMPRPRVAAPVVAGGAALLMLVYPWRLIPRAANPQNLAPILLTVVPAANWVSALVALGFAALAAVVFLYSRRDRPRILWAFVGSWFAIVGIIAVTVFTGASRYVVRTSMANPADWVDRAAGSGARVAVLWTEPGTTAFARPSERQRTAWVAEFFNRSIDRVYVLGPAFPFGLPQVRVFRRDGGQLVTAAGLPMRADFVLAKCRAGVTAPLVAHDTKTQMGLYRTAGPVALRPTRATCSGGRNAR